MATQQFPAASSAPCCSPSRNVTPSEACFSHTASAIFGTPDLNDSVLPRFCRFTPVASLTFRVVRVFAVTFFFFVPFLGLKLFWRVSPHLSFRRICLLLFGFGPK